MAAKNSTCNCPTIISPNGGELVVSRVLNITWYSPTPHDTDNQAVWYELFFTDKYESDKKINWKQIAFVPAMNSSFNWKLPVGVHGDKCRLGIRCRDAKGAVSNIAVIGGDFSILIDRLASPTVVSPVSASVHRLSMSIVFDHGAILGNISQRAFYQVYYSSEALGIDWTPVNENIPFGSDIFIWDLRDLESSNDYHLKIILANEDGITSEPFFVDNLSILQMNYVILDSTPPKGRIETPNNLRFTRNKDIALRLTAFDEATDIVSVVLEQVDITPDPYTGLVTETVDASGEQLFSEFMTWHLAGEDGEKVIQARFKDVAGNFFLDSELDKYFALFLENNAQTVTAITTQNGIVWTAFSNGSDFSLFKDKEMVADLEGEATAIEVFDDIPYVAIKDSDNKGELQKFLDNEMQSVQAFSDLDSVINAMGVFSDELYMSMQNGDLYNFDNTSFLLVSAFDKQIKGMYSDVNLLYLFFENTVDVDVYDGLTFSNMSVLDANQQN